MEFFKTISGNGYEVIFSLVMANLIAQGIKVIGYGIKRRKFNFMLLLATGGMPSSHSSTVSAMATSVGLIEGFDSSVFALAACFAGIVMFDAAGVRRAASKQAMVLNKMIRELFTEDHAITRERLKEFLGHTPMEVFAGAALGIAVSFAIRYGLTHYVL